MGDAVVVEQVSKQFRRFHGLEARTLKESFIAAARRGRTAERFWALRDVSFACEKGRMLGVVGRNGAGKSTLLRLIGGVGQPDSGRIHADGRVGALLELGANFHPDLTGRENVFVSGVVAGLTRKDVARRFDEIVAFAEVEAFIDSPIHTFSTGMQLRLAFAVAAHTNPDILLIDEVLAVGDIAFQRKCLDYIERFRSDGGTIIVVSHDPRLVGRMCDEALWLAGGEIAASGAAEEVVAAYANAMADQTRARTPVDAAPVVLPGGKELVAMRNRFGSLDIQICDVRLLDARGKAVDVIEPGESLRIELDYQVRSDVRDPVAGITISRDDQVVFESSAALGALGVGGGPASGGAAIELARLDLAAGTYSVDVGIYEHDWAYAYDYHWHVYRFEVRSPNVTEGLLDAPHRWEALNNRVAAESVHDRP